MGTYTLILRNKILLIIGLLSSLTTFSQVDCQIYYQFSGNTNVYHRDTTLCRNQQLTLFTEYSDTLNYLWEPGGSTSNEINITIDTIERVYYLYISNLANTFSCVDSLHLNSYIIPDPLIADSLVCYNQTIELGTKPLSGFYFIWRPGDVNAITYKAPIKDTTTYYLDVYQEPDSVLYCTDSITLYTYPRIYVTFDQVNKGCPGDCKSQVYGTASGGFPPYHYEWDALVAPNDSTLALGLCSESSYTLYVTDTVCIFDTAYTVETYHLPEINIEVYPDSIYYTNPVAEFTFENKSADSIELTNWIWIYPDSTTSNALVGSFVFIESDSVLFVYTTEDGCSDTVVQEVTIKKFEMDIPNVFTPNGDGYNETWEIPDLDKYISNEIIVFDRWGRRVFEASDYRDSWDGGKLSDGVYFFVLKCAGYWQEDLYKGSVTIIGSKY